jgi:hypothetical protein
MITVLTRRLPIRVAALLAVGMLMVAALTAGLTYSFPAGHRVADDGVIHGYGILADNGVIHSDGIQGSGIRPDDDGVIHGF